MRRLTPGYRLSFMDSTEEVASVLSEADAQVAVEKGVLRLQAVFRGARERAQYQTRLRDTAYRERVVFEILTTEQSYVESLQCCVDVYLRPLEAVRWDTLGHHRFCISLCVFSPLFFRR